MCRPLFCLLLLVGLAAPAEWVPFVMPWNDSAPGPTDLSGWNRPIDESRRVAVDANGHFSAAGARVRILGMNLAGDSPFAPTNKADRMAARLSKFGINCVRFHHIDPPWATGGGLIRYTSASSRSLNEAQLERLHFLIARLKARGIYSDINLVTGREFRSGDGLGSAVTSMDPKDQHVLAMFHDVALQLQKEFATQVLTRVNPFTGLPLARDPAVAFVEILNENGLVQKWYEGALDKLPAFFAGVLQQRWNDWLKERHGDDAGLAAAWHALDIPLGANLLRNGTFQSGTTGWNLEQHQGAAATMARTTEFNGAPSLKLTVTRAGTDAWHVQLNQAGLRLAAGRLYTLTFSAKASAALTLDVSAMMAHDPWQALGLSEGVRVTPEWQTFSRTFVASRSDANARVNFGGLGTRVGTLWLADVRFQEGGSLGALPEGTSLALGNVPSIRHAGEGFKGTDEARRDWLRFLMARENRYYDAMRTHLREEVGYPGLVFGTIMANSPAAVQTRLDAIDTHAYWQHPVFPGVPWDPVNWYVVNSSMLNAPPGETTISWLSRQRIKGRPMLVTEYQHASPNSFSAEGPLILAAYAALQDWDGIWFFDYGWGNDAPQGAETQPMGRIRSFFDTAQHSAKMANLWLAAHWFRRGDVQRAREEVTLALKPEAELELLLRRAGAWYVFNTAQVDMPGALALVHRLSVDYGPDASGLPAPPSAPTTTVSDTGELNWGGPAAGILTVNTPRSRAVLGSVGDRVVALGDVEIRLLPGAPSWATVGISLVKGDTFAGGGTALVVATAGCENTGQTWKAADRASLTSWGSAPVLIEPVPFQLRLPVPAARVRAWSLDGQGQRRGEVQVQEAVDGMALVVSAAADATLWWEVEIAPPPLVTFDTWREQNFTAPELADEAVSGPAGTPAGDGVPNLVKYALGLQAKTAVHVDDLVRWGVSPSTDGDVLWLSYTRRKGLDDVRLRPYFSESLPGWREAPEQVLEDLGDRVRVRTEQPVAAGMGLLKLEARGNQ